MDSLLIQYIAVFLILGVIIAWVIYKLLKKGDNQSSPCGACSFSEACRKRNLVADCADKDKPPRAGIKK